MKRSLGQIIIIIQNKHIMYQSFVGKYNYAPRYYQRIVILSLTKKLESRQMQLLDKTLFVWGLRYRQSPFTASRSFCHLGSLLQLFICPQCIWMWRTGPEMQCMNASSSKLLAWTHMSPHQSLVVKYQPTKNQPDTISEQREVKMKFRKHSKQVIRFSPSRFPISLDHST